ncbi:DNRLRE domain-containing protein [Streptomyces sp. Mg1]|uniref:DNRLRE domain-containing protein n=1 Tax=Streptomyces sp. Mg1 TaxID=465541 RepID=UPI00017E9708|nr:DNRLRE domain-containing protein [Streptomyces sp. Mg1]EDX20599.1 conserved hypothetical protein [Streptomyces sp. Mg1]
MRRSTDVELLAGSDSVKETLVLKDASAPTEWRFPLALNGLTAKLDGHGGIVFSDAGGHQKAWMPAGWMEDSRHAPDSNEGVISSGVTYDIVQQGTRQVLVVTLDKKWLSDPERAFPVRVDPSATGLQAASGTYVEAPYNQNFSSDTVLKVGTYDGGAHKAAGFLKFNGLDTTLKNAYVVNANLSLYNTWSQSCTARPVTVHEITSDWSGAGTSAYPGPATGGALGSKSFAHAWRPSGTNNWTCAPAWEAIPLGESGRKLVDDWTHGRKPNYGLAVKAATDDSKSWKQFGSDDYPNGKPSLDVTWSKYGATYGLGGFVQPMTATSEGTFKVTVTNQGQETWGKTSNYKLRYDLFDANGNKVGGDYWSKIRWTPMPYDVAPGASATVDAKIAPPDARHLHDSVDDGRVRCAELRRRRSSGPDHPVRHGQRPAVPDGRCPAEWHAGRHAHPDAVGRSHRRGQVPRLAHLPVRGVRGRGQGHPQELPRQHARGLAELDRPVRLAELGQDLRLVRLRQRRQGPVRPDRARDPEHAGPTAGHHLPPGRSRQRATQSSAGTGRTGGSA